MTYLERGLFRAPIGFGFDVDLDWAFRLVDWSGSMVNLTLRAPDLYNLAWLPPTVHSNCSEAVCLAARIFAIGSGVIFVQIS